MRYTKATHVYGVGGESGQKDYFVTDVDEMVCPDCGKPVTIKSNGRTLEDHRIPGTYLSCDLSNARMKKNGDEWVVVKKEEADLQRM